MGNKPNCSIKGAVPDGAKIMADADKCLSF